MIRPSMANVRLVGLLAMVVACLVYADGVADVVDNCTVRRRGLRQWCRD
ncbi:MAG: hypothetical protein Q8N51_06940 [Gammaproteobacteria bacterium]|nr:hypothetical protein [Gammaproteobacteria bacterium]